MKKRHFLFVVLFFFLFLVACDEPSKSEESFTVTWCNDDGSVLEVDNNVIKGSIPSFDGKVPEKTNDNNIKYEFSGWSPTIREVTENITYKAVFKAINSVTVTWINYNGDILLVYSVNIGDMPIYNGITPTKNINDGKEYKFSGWSPNIVEAQSDVTYVAIFDEVLSSYNINYDLGEGFNDEENPSTYTPNTGIIVLKEANKPGFVFSGWEINGRIVLTIDTTDLVGDITLKARWQTLEEYSSFNYTFRNNKLVLTGVKDKSLKTIIIPDGFDEIGNSAFAGCTELTELTISASISRIGKRVFADCPNLKTIIIENKKINLDSSLIRESNIEKIYYIGTEEEWNSCIDDEYGYFSSIVYFYNDEGSIDSSMYWHYQDGKAVEWTFEITFINYDGSVISKNRYKYGEFVIGPVEGAIKPSDDMCDYEFIGWDKEVTLVDGDKTYKAEYEPIYRKYEITFVTYNDIVIYKKEYTYGDEVVYGLGYPSKPADETYTYVFKGWDKELTPVDGNKTYKAEYTPVYIDYEIRFINYDYSLISNTKYHYGDIVTLPENPSKPSDNEFDYEFTGWDKEVTDVDGNKTYKAEYTPVYREFEVTFVDHKDVVISKQKYHYGETIVVPEIELITYTDGVYEYTFKGWNEEIYTVFRDITYKAVYNRKYLQFRCVAYDIDKVTPLVDETVNYGSQVSVPIFKEADAQYMYSFVGWYTFDDELYSTDDYVYVYEDLYIYRKMTTTLRKYLVRWFNYDGTLLHQEYDSYGTIPEYKWATPERERGEDYYYEFVGWNPEITPVQNVIDYTAILEKKDASLEYQLTQDGTGYIVIGIGTIISSTIDIPSTYNGLPVIGIGDNAFVNNTTIEGISLPDSLISIGDYAFYGCQNIRSLNLPDSLETIGQAAFVNCRIESITIPNKVKDIGINLFKGCEFLTNVLIPNSVESIGNGAFSNCSMLETITIPDSVTSIGALVFTGTSLKYATIPALAISSILIDGQLKEVVITSGDSIKDNAFNGCPNLATIVLPDTIKSIGKMAFANCPLLIDIELPDNLESIEKDAFSGTYITNATIPGIAIPAIRNTSLRVAIITNGDNIPNYAFDGCRHLNYLSLPDSITSIGDYAFRDCASFNNNELPANVKSIGDYAFSNCDFLTSFTIPDGVESIGDYAFSDCLYLSNIVIPDSVVTIGANAFYKTKINTASAPALAAKTLNNPSLNNVVITSGDTILANTFKDCQQLHYVTLPNTIKHIGDYAFANTPAMQDAVIPNEVEDIGIGAFKGCGINTIVLPNTITAINSQTFSDCWLLKSVSLPTNLDSIGDNAFYNCTALKEIIIPDSVTTIGNKAFENANINIVSMPAIIAPKVNNHLLIKVTITSGDEIPAYSFSDCIFLNEIVMPSAITKIGVGAFYGCQNLQAINIPANVEEVGEDAFKNCELLTNIYINNISKWTNIKSKYQTGIVDRQYNLYFNSSLVDELVIPNEVEIIDEFAFYNCISITSLKLPDTLKNIELSAFENCSNLETIDFGNGIESIGRFAFYSCHSLLSINIPNSVKLIDEYAFYFCFSLTDVTIGDEVTTIEGYIFYNCPIEVARIPAWAFRHVNRFWLKELTITSGEEIPEEAFSYCSSLETVTISDTVKTIGTSAFYQSSIKEINIPDSVVTIGANAFFECPLKEIEIPNSVTSIGAYAFSRCKFLESLTIPNSISVINEGVFDLCESLKEVIIPDSVTLIDRGAFTHCVSLRKIDFGNGVKTIGEYAFNSCPFVSLIIPNNIETIENYAFSDNFSLVEIYNLSNIEIFMGSTTNGSIGQYAKIIHTSLDEESIVTVDDDGFIFTYWDNIGYLLGCYHITEEMVLPTSFEYDDQTIDEYIIVGKAFYYMEKIKSLTIPNSVIDIVNSAFFGCVNLALIYNYSSLNLVIGTSDYGYVAYYAEAINGDELSIVVDDFVFVYDNDEWKLIAYVGLEKELILPTGFEYQNKFISNYAIESLNNINKTLVTAIVIQSDVTRINEGILSGYSALETLIIPFIGLESDSLNSYSLGYIFGQVSYDNSYNVKQHLTMYVSDNLYTEDLIDYYIPDSLHSVGVFGGKIRPYAFENCSSIVEIAIQSVKELEGYLFVGCTSLTVVYLVDEILNISDNVFEGCSNLNFLLYNNAYYYGTLINPYLILVKVESEYTSSIIIHEDCKFILNDVFDGCVDLRKVYFESQQDEKIKILTGNDPFIDADWYYYTKYGVSESRSGNWWYYDSDGVTIIDFTL